MKLCLPENGKENNVLYVVENEFSERRSRPEQRSQAMLMKLVTPVLILKNRFRRLKTVPRQPQLNRARDFSRINLRLLLSLEKSQRG